MLGPTLETVRKWVRGKSQRVSAIDWPVEHVGFALHRGSRRAYPRSRHWWRCSVNTSFSLRFWLVGLLFVTSGCTGEADATTTSGETQTPSSLASVTTSHSGPTTSLPATGSTSTANSSTTTAFDSTTTTGSGGRLLGRNVVIDPGHNGMNWAHPEEIGRLVDIGNGQKACNTAGTSTYDGLTEAEFTWAVATLVLPLLQREGATVVLTRHDNDGWGPCIDERAAVGNRARADAVVSIHADGGPDDGRGFHVIHPAETPGLTDDIYDASLRLAQALHDAYLSTSMPVADYIGEDGYSARADLGGLNLSDVPGVFLETGNMRNATDAAMLSDTDFQAAIAAAIVEGLIDFFDASK